MPERITVVGWSGGELAKDAARAVEQADLVVGGRRLLDALAPARRSVAIDGDGSRALDAIASEPGRVCVLASGDPGFFGIGRMLADCFGPEQLEIHPAPSSVSLAFARAGLPWDDALVVSAHGRPLADAARRAASAAKVAVLVAPAAPAEALARELLRLGAPHDRVIVGTRLGTADERVTETDLEGLAAGRWDPMSVVLLLSSTDAVAPAPSLAWGRSDNDFAARAGMITKAEVRAVALGKLALAPTGVLWDVGAGSGSVAIEAARLAPGLRVVAVERDAADAARIRSNALAHDASIEVVEGEAPGALADLPDPDRAFVGGGGLAVLDAVLDRLRPDGRVVATYAALDRAAAAYGRLGHLVEVGVSEAEGLPDGGVRLAARNPVFVAWGPAE